MEREQRHISKKGARTGALPINTESTTERNKPKLEIESKRHISEKKGARGPHRQTKTMPLRPSVRPQSFYRKTKNPPCPPSPQKQNKKRTQTFPAPRPVLNLPIPTYAPGGSALLKHGPPLRPIGSAQTSYISILLLSTSYFLSRAYNFDTGSIDGSMIHT